MLRILRINDVIKNTGISRSSIYAMIKEGEFPKQRSIGRHSVGWLESEIDEWIKEKFHSDE